MPENIGEHIETSSTVMCPSCGHYMHCYDPRSTYFGCSDCDTYFVCKGGDRSRMIYVDVNNITCVNSIPLGASGSFNDRQYIVSGLLEKKDNASHVQWKEYLLFCPGQEYYTTLAEYNGHWTLIDKTDEANFDVRQNMDYQWEVFRKDPFQKFTQYTSYKFRVIAAKGAFDWNVMDDSESLLVEEYVSPPELVVVETANGDQYTWFAGQYLQPVVVSAAFGLSVNDLPQKIGKGVAEPQKLDKQWRPFKQFTVLMICLVVLTQLFCSMLRPSRIAHEGVYVVTPDTASWGGGNMLPIKTESFKVKKDGAVEISMIANISNEWLEVPLSMVNEQTGKEYEFSNTLEFWTGYEDGETWSEGSMDGSGVMSSVPSGTYHINVYPYSEIKKDFSLVVKVEENTVLYSNMWWMLGLILLGVLVQAQRVENLRSARFD